MVSNKSVVFAAVPDGLPEEGKHLVIKTDEFDKEQAPSSSGITVRTNYLSFDPYMRGRMRGPDAGKSYVPPFELNKPLTNCGIATVLQSSSDKFKKDDLLIIDSLPFSEYVSISSSGVEKQCKLLQNPHKLNMADFLGPLGMPGLTAYSSFYEIGKPKKGETIFISAASGAVGQVVGQLAKHEGLRVVGSVGDDKKLEFITKELGFDGGFNYTTDKTADALKRLAPNGVDIYFENVGGEQLEAAIGAMNDFGRIIACGMISQYNLPPGQQYGVKNLMNVVAKRLHMQGFIVGDPSMGPKHTADHQKNVSAWIADGSFKPKTDTTVGIDNAVQGLLGLCSGKNYGKAVLEVAKL